MLFREVLEAEKKGSTVEMKLAKITNEVKNIWWKQQTALNLEIKELMNSYLDDKTITSSKNYLIHFEQL